MATTIKPLYDRVLVKRLENEQMSAGGIIIPDSAKDKPSKGKVIATASKMVKVGESVIYKKWGGNEVELEGKDVLIIEDKDILAIL